MNASKRWVPALILLAALSVPALGQTVALSWGSQTILENPLTDVTAISAGNLHNLALKRDGTVVCWGAACNLPAGLSGVVAVSAGGLHSVALENGGTAVAWGVTTAGTPATVPAGLTGVTAVAAGAAHTLALKSDGTVVAWGTFSDPVLPCGNNCPAQVPAGLSGVVAIAAGPQYSLALKSDGTVVAWGGAWSGETTVPAGLSGVVAIAAGPGQCWALRADGTVVAWGGGASYSPSVSGVAAVAVGDCGGLALKNDGTVAMPDSVAECAPPAGLSNVAAIAAGRANIALKSDGTVVVWTRRNYYAEGFTPGGVRGDLRAMALGMNNNLILQGDGALRWWGNTVYAPPPGLSGLKAAATAPAIDHSIALKNDGTVTAWGRNNYHQSNVPAGLSSVTAIAEGEAHALALKSDGTVVSWGDGLALAPLATPAGLTGVTAIAAGMRFSVALKNDGTVVAWGDNSIWGVDRGTDVPSGLSGVTAISAGPFHTLALKSDGTVAAWGDNRYGQTDVPVGLSGVIGVAAGWYHSVALKNDGTLVSWGDNDYGQNNIPVGLTGVTALAAGPDVTMVLKAADMPTTTTITAPAGPHRAYDPVTFDIRSTPAYGLLGPTGAVARVSVNGRPRQVVNLLNGRGGYTAVEGFPGGVSTVSVEIQDPSGAFASSNASTTVTATKTSQTIAFDPIPDRGRGDPAPVLHATASSGLPVAFQVVSGPGRVQGNTVVVTGPGRIVVRAIQSGDDSYEPARAERSFLGDATRLRLTTSPAGLTIRVDGVASATPVTLLFLPGASHTLLAEDQTALSQTRYVFAGWADGGPAQRTVAVGNEDLSYEARFAATYRVQVEVRPAGTGSVIVEPASPSGYYAAGAVVGLRAVAEPGYHFAGYAGGLTSGQRVVQFAVTKQTYVVANFAEGPSLEAVVDAAGFHGSGVAPGGLFALFGEGLGETAHASSVPLPTTLGGSALSILDSAGSLHAVPSLAVSRTQVNFLAPDALALGPATLTLTDAAGRKASLAVTVVRVAPGIFTADASGRGAPAGVAGPIEMTGGGAYVTLYGTGLRHGAVVAAVAGGVPLEVLYAGAQPTLAGLDQLNLKLPPALAGRGEVDLLVTVEGRAANTVRIVVR